MRNRIPENKVTIHTYSPNGKQFKIYSNNIFFKNKEVKYDVDEEKIIFSLPTMEDYKRVIRPQRNDSGGHIMLISSNHLLPTGTFDIERDDSGDFIEIYYTP